ncbi:MAG: hypothetical protein RIQ60_1333 [Pseudomonadota bacterium]|jgi:hypothetical protein
MTPAEFAALADAHLRPPPAAPVPPPPPPPAVVPMRSARGWRWLLVLLVLLAGFGALRAWLLVASGTGLQVDEAQYWHWSLDLQWGYFSKPPVIAALIAASTALLGDNVLGVKALAMVCWLLVALLVYGFTRELMRDALRPPRALAAPRGSAEPPLAPTDLARPPARHAAAVPVAPMPAPDLPDRIAFWAALLFTTTPAAGLLGMAVTTDAPLLLCWTLASWLLWRALRSGRVSAWVLLGVVLGVGLLSKYTMAAWLPSAFVLAWLARQKLRRERAAQRLDEAAAAASRLESGRGLAGAGQSGRPGGGASSATAPAAPALTPAPRRTCRLRCLPGLILSCGVALLACLPHLAWNAAWGWPTWHHTADITAAAHRAGGVGALASLGEFIGGQLLLIGPVLAIWMLVLVGGWLRSLLTLASDNGWRGLPGLILTQASGLARQPQPRAAELAEAAVDGGRDAAAERPGGGPATTAAAAAVRRPGGGRSAALAGDSEPQDLATRLAPARRHLLWLALPLLGLGAAQALNARAQMNWTAPVVPLLCIWLALHLAAADAAAVARRRRHLAGWGMALSLLLTLFAAAAPTVAAALERPWPARLDLYIRMRGWPEAYAELEPWVEDHPGWRVLGVNRDVISHGAWLWRDLDIEWAAWREPGPPQDHYQLTIPYDRASRTGVPRSPVTSLDGALPRDRTQLGEPLLVLSNGQLPVNLRRRLRNVELLHKASVGTAPGRVLTLYLWSARLPDQMPEPRP